MFSVKFESFDIESSELCDMFTVFVSVPGFCQSFNFVHNFGWEEKFR